EQRSYVGAIEASGRSLLSIVDELLDTARSDTGEIDLDIAPFNPERLVEDLCELMSPRAHARGIDLACYVDPALDGPLLGDAGRIRQVLLNLIGNGIRFTDAGGVLVRVEPAAGARGERRVRFEVRDTGIGIAPADVERIFLAWEQGDNSSGRGGSGLGLSISRRLVERMGGRLEVESRQGEGSTFRFTLPLAPADATQADDGAGGERAEETAPSLAGRRVLLAVPDAPRREALAAYVRAFGGAAVVVPPETAFAEETQERTADAEALIICDASHAETLRRALARGDARVRRTWLLLRPEQRRELADLMAARALGGWLITPVRRGTFVVQIAEAGGPRRREEEPMEAPSSLAASDRRDAATGRSLRVLLVEDNPVNATLARAILERAGHAVTHVESGDAALARLERAARERNDADWPDVVLMDVHMPGMDGLETTTRLRRLERRAGRRRTPVLALTAGNSPGERERCLAAGMDGFLAKPFEPAELQAALAGIGRRHTAA
ncbi:MAG TPA: response regulator, partial [Thermopetrobacter sp.]|nr:response regulator [Thermopetrobacter sp.]